MARAVNQSTTRLSQLFRDPFLRAAFKAAEDDGLVPVDIDRPKTLRGGAAALPELEAA